MENVLTENYIESLSLEDAAGLLNLFIKENRKLDNMKQVSEILIDVPVKIVFKKHDDRFPIIGIFVNTGDEKNLSSKGMIRFVSQRNFDAWRENPNVGLTRIFVVSDISQIIPVPVSI